MRAANGIAPVAGALAQAPAAAISDLAIIKKLTSVADISRLLHDTLARERAVDQELEQLLGRRVQVEQGPPGFAWVHRRGARVAQDAVVDQALLCSCKNKGAAKYSPGDLVGGPLQVWKKKAD